MLERFIHYLLERRYDLEEKSQCREGNKFTKKMKKLYAELGYCVFNGAADAEIRNIERKLVNLIDEQMEQEEQKCQHI